MRVGVVTEAGRRVADSCDINSFVAEIGQNTGNIAFQQVIQQHLDDDVTYIGWAEQPSELIRRFDMLFVPEASVIVETKDFGWKADFIRAANLPVVAVGVGFQDGRAGKDPLIPSGTLRYLKELAHRTELIGVRGDRTRRILEAGGITNVVTVGCPSLFWNVDAGLGRRIAHTATEWSRPLRPAVTGGPDKRVLARAHRRLLSWVNETDGTWIAQSGYGLKAALEGLPYSVPSIGFERVLPNRRSRHRTEIVPIAFSDARLWISHVANFDVSVSPRIHASLLATQAAVPSFCVAHDGRTKELASTCGIPTIAPLRLGRAKDVEDLIDKESFDGRLFDRTRVLLAKRYVGLLEAAGLTAKANLRALAMSDDS